MSEKENIATQKRHQCSICHRRFVRSEHLKRHTNTHTEKKPFSCFCGKGFGRRDLLKRHERIGRHLMSNRQPSPSVKSANDNVVPSQSPNAQGSTQALFNESDEPTVADLPSSVLDDDMPFMNAWFTSDTFQNFDAFISSTMGLNTPFHYGPADNQEAQIFPLYVVNGDSVNIGPSQRSLSSSFSSEPDMGSVHELKRIPYLWTVTQKQWDSLNVTLHQYRHVLSDFVLPSPLAISRYLTGYYEDFQDHQAVLHTATYRPQESLQSSESPELVLAICACGAGTRYEKRSAIRLFRASKAVILDVYRNRGRNETGNTETQSQTASSAYRALRTAQAAMLLSTFAIMEGTHALVHEAASLNDFLVDYVRSYCTSARTTNEKGAEICWQDWIFEESARRTHGAIFNILMMFTMALDTSPALLTSQFHTDLPSSTPEWTASSHDAWMEARRLAPRPVAFQQAYATLFDPSTLQTHHLHAPLGNLVLINAILQRIYLARQLQMDSSSEALRKSDLDEIEIALDRWTHAWKQAPESILDPRNLDASNSFTSTSYLGLAYVRLHTTFGSKRHLSKWQPKTTGFSLHHAPAPLRGPRVDAALLHAAQAFAIPVKFGIEYLGRKQFHRWDLQNFIWHLEAAVFLSKWFRNVAETCHHDPLSDFESRLISVMNSLVEKAEESVDPILSNSGWVRGQTTVIIAGSLSHRIARLWACLYNRQNSPWGLVQTIGESLAEYAHLTEAHAS